MKALILIIEIALTTIFLVMIGLGLISVLQMENTPTIIVGVLVVISGVVGIIGSYRNLSNIFISGRNTLQK